MAFKKAIGVKDVIYTLNGRRYQPNSLLKKIIGSSNNIIAGSHVRINPGATYYDGQHIPDWVMADTWYVYQVKGDRAVINRNPSGTNAIMSPIDVNYLSLVDSTVSSGNPYSIKAMFVIRDFDQSSQTFKIVLSWDSYDNTSPFGVAYFRDSSTSSTQALSGPGSINISSTPNKIGSITREDVSSGYNQSVTLLITSAPYSKVDVGFARAGKFTYTAPITCYKNNSVVANGGQVASAAIFYYYQLDLLNGTVKSLL